MVALNEHGARIGQDHPMAVLSDADVDLVHQLHDEGLSIRRIATAMEVSPSQVFRVVSGQQRGQSVARFKRA